MTGASRGIGKTVAQSFASFGAKVALLSRTLNDLVELENEITNNGGSAMRISTDVSDLDSFQSAVQQIIENFGTVNILVNNKQKNSYFSLKTRHTPLLQYLLPVGLGPSSKICP